jgi:hypothetical protein
MRFDFQAYVESVIIHKEIFLSGVLSDNRSHIRNRSMFIVALGEVSCSIKPNKANIYVTSFDAMAMGTCVFGPLFAFDCLINGETGVGTPYSRLYLNPQA